MMSGYWSALTFPNRRLAHRPRQTKGLRMAWNQGYQSQLVKPVPDCTRANGFSDRHPVFTGIETLYEGVTIGHLHNLDRCDGLVQLMRGSDGGVVTSAYDKGGHRILIDGGFTRLYDSLWNQSAGTARFVINAACWMYNWEGRNAEWQVKRAKERAKVAEAAVKEWQSFRKAKEGGDAAGGGGQK